MASESAGLKNGKSERVIGLLCLPAKMDSLHPNQEDSVGDLVRGTAIGGVQSVICRFMRHLLSGRDSC